MCGNNSAIRVTGWVAIRDRTSLTHKKGSIAARWQDATKLRSTAAVLPPSSLPKKTQLLRPTATPRIARSVALCRLQDYAVCSGAKKPLIAFARWTWTTIFPLTGGRPKVRVDAMGNIYATGPGGVWVFAADGKHLGTIKPPETPANCGWATTARHCTCHPVAVTRFRLSPCGSLRNVRTLK